MANNDERTKLKLRSALLSIKARKQELQIMEKTKRAQLKAMTKPRKKNTLENKI